METAVQRHTHGFKAFWNENKNKLSGRDWMKIFISVWEAGRGKKKNSGRKRVCAP